MSQTQQIIYQSNLVAFGRAKSVLSALCMEERSGTLVLTAEGGDGAGILLEAGKITDVAFNTLRGNDALSGLRGIQFARYFFEGEFSDLPSVGDGPTDMLDTQSILDFLGVPRERKLEPKVIDEVEAEKSRVMVVDDSRMVRSVVRKILTKNNIEVLECEDGEQAVIAIEKEQPDVVLLDVVMPGMDGNEVLRRVRDTEYGRTLPIIFLTSSESLIEELGSATGCILKPFKPNELMSQMEKNLPSSKLDAA